MAGFDGTGPRGMGPRTGGGRGFCPPGAGTAYGYGAGMYRGAGRGGIPWGGGRGRAWGGGRGWYGTAGFNAPFYGAYDPYAGLNAQQEVEFLKNQAVSMEQELEQIRKRIEDLSVQENKSE